MATKTPQTALTSKTPSKPEVAKPATPVAVAVEAAPTEASGEVKQKRKGYPRLGQAFYAGFILQVKKCKTIEEAQKATGLEPKRIMALINFLKSDRYKTNEDGSKTLVRQGIKTLPSFGGGHKGAKPSIDWAALAKLAE
jgi:hypothetical protein